MENETQDKRGEELVYELGKVIGQFVYKGRIVTRLKNGGFKMGNLVYKNFQELEYGYNQSVKLLGDNLK